MQFINDSKTYYIIIIYKGGGNYGNYLNNSFISSDNVRTFILVFLSENNLLDDIEN